MKRDTIVVEGLIAIDNLHTFWMFIQPFVDLTSDETWVRMKNQLNDHQNYISMYTII